MHVIDYGTQDVPIREWSLRAAIRKAIVDLIDSLAPGYVGAGDRGRVPIHTAYCDSGHEPDAGSTRPRNCGIEPTLARSTFSDHRSRRERKWRNGDTPPNQNWKPDSQDRSSRTMAFVQGPPCWRRATHPGRRCFKVLVASTLILHLGSPDHYRYSAPTFGPSQVLEADHLRAIDHRRVAWQSTEEKMDSNRSQSLSRRSGLCIGQPGA